MPPFPRQLLLSLTLITITALLCFISVEYIGYKAVALILLMAVSLNAMLFDVYPVMISAVISALIWNFFFIPPILNLHIGEADDALMFLMYFVIASVHAVMTFKIRDAERARRDQQEKEKSILLYNTLLNSLSHELRTPISTIIGAIDTIREQDARLSDSIRRELYAEIDIAGMRLDRQVGNLLNMSRLEAGFIQPTSDWCDVNELIFSAIKRYKDESASHFIQFDADDSLPLFKLDGGLLEQILNNLIHNALQHTPPGTTIRIQAAKSGNACEITISDNGDGFPDDEIDHVFNKFYRLENTAAGGTGLGLSIVKGFCEAMGATLSLENRSEGGARFTITIPSEHD